MSLTVIVDYESGNLHSAQKAFDRMAAELGGQEIAVSNDPDLVARADRIVLPGDGAFPACREALFAVDGVAEAMIEAVNDRAVPFLGICVGMQLLATLGLEYRQTPGLGWIGGQVVPITPSDPGLPVPHMGWNDLRISQAHPVLDGLKTGDHAYFVHSFQMRTESDDQRLADVDYGGSVTAIVGRDNIIGTQFHPEKSQATGLRLIANFLRWRP